MAENELCGVILAPEHRSENTEVHSYQEEHPKITIQLTDLRSYRRLGLPYSNTLLAGKAQLSKSPTRTAQSQPNRRVFWWGYFSLSCSPVEAWSLPHSSTGSTRTHWRYPWSRRMLARRACSRSRPWTRAGASSWDWGWDTSNRSPWSARRRRWWKPRRGQRWWSTRAFCFCDRRKWWTEWWWRAGSPRPNTNPKHNIKHTHPKQ